MERRVGARKGALEGDVDVYFGKHRVAARLLNVSSGGIGFALPTAGAQPAVGERIHLAARVTNGRWWVGSAIVRWVNEERVGVAVRPLSNGALPEDYVRWVGDTKGTRLEAEQT